jgi:hypothetical protein
MLTCLNCSHWPITALSLSINSQAYIILTMWLLCLLCKSYRLSSKLSFSSLLLSLFWLVSLYRNRYSLQYRQNIAMDICLYTLIYNLTLIHYILACCMICLICSDVYLLGSVSSSILCLCCFGPVYRRCSIFLLSLYKNRLWYSFSFA